VLIPDPSGDTRRGWFTTYEGSLDGSGISEPEFASVYSGLINCLWLYGSTGLT